MIFKKSIVIVLVFSVFCATLNAQDLDSVYNRIYKPLYDVNVDTAEVGSLLNLLTPFGRWSDINYSTNTQGSFPAYSHVLRITKISRGYVKPGSSLYNSPSVQQKILLALEWYLDSMPNPTNWWYRDIGSPLEISTSLILLRDKINIADLLRYSNTLLNYNLSMTGANYTWLATISLRKACIEKSDSMATTIFNSIASKIVITPDTLEGVKADNSFYQHSRQLYNGGYGREFLRDMTDFIYIARGTVYKFSPQKIDIISELILKGNQLFVYRKAYDFGVIGREISRPSNNGYNDYGRSSTLLSVLTKMIWVDPARSAQYTAMRNHITAAQPFASSGNNYFHKSEIMTHHGTNYYLSARMISERIVGTESMNGEGLKSYYLPLGATNILTHGNEYLNIAPMWDWSRIPGVTAELGVVPPVPTYLTGSQIHSGGVSNGTEGVSGFVYDYNGIKAQKSYFFFGNAMVCLGAGIHKELLYVNPIITSVNQCLSSGSVHLNDGSVHQFVDTSATYTNSLNWVHHDKVGYIFPGPGTVTVKNSTQSGKWSSINSSGSTVTVADTVFSIWVDQSGFTSADSYQYIVVPDITYSNFQNYSSSHGFVIVKNDTNIQAVSNDALDVFGAVFYRAGSVSLGNGLVIGVDRAAVIILKRDVETNPDGYTLSVSDPTYSQSVINVHISKPLYGVGSVWNTALSRTDIAVVLPANEYKGASVTNEYKNCGGSDEWAANSFSVQTGIFSVDFDVTPTGNNIDATLGLSSGVASTYTMMACIVRFNTSGKIDARDSNMYNAINVIPYSAGIKYHIRMDINITTKKYDVYVTPEGSIPQAVATGFSFRAEQHGITHINNWTKNTTSCLLDVNEFVLNCGGSQWEDNSFAPQTNVFTVNFSATPFTNSVNGTIGLANGVVSTYTNMACIVRFNSNGTLDVRTDTMYKADTIIPYLAGVTYHFKVDVDVSSKKYTVFVTPDGGSTYLIAQSYNFRAEQMGVTQLNNLTKNVISCVLRVENFTILNTAGIAPEADGYLMMLYPNPSKGNFTLNYYSENSEPSEIIITDFLSNVVSKTSVANTSGVNSVEINADLLSNGNYFLTFYQGQKKMTRKLIIIR